VARVVTMRQVEVTSAGRVNLMTFINS